VKDIYATKVSTLSTHNRNLSKQSQTSKIDQIRELSRFLFEHLEENFPWKKFLLANNFRLTLYVVLRLNTMLQNEMFPEKKNLSRNCIMFCHHLNTY